jgi:hypothetical protein
MKSCRLMFKSTYWIEPDLQIWTLLVLRHGRFMACNICDACMHTVPYSNLMHVEKRETNQTHGILCQIKMQIEKHFEPYPTLYRTKRFFHMCSDLGPLATVFAQDSICRRILGCTANTTTPTLSLGFMEVQRCRATDVYRANTTK